MQYWPRRRATRIYARVRSWISDVKDIKMLGFAGYKVGMTHLIVTDNRKKSTTANTEIAVPVTIIECPPLKVLSVRFYKKYPYGLSVSSEVLAEKLDKELGRKIKLPKKTKKVEDVKDFDQVRLLVHTQPKLASLGKKKPEIFEIGISGSKEEAINFAKEQLGKEISVADVFKEGEQVDIHAITKGKGFQGPVKRFGIKRRFHKSEKGVRGPGSLGGWRSQAQVMPRVPHAGQTGMFQRTELNKHILKISEKPEEINPKGGFVRYGMVKNSYMLLKGSVAGPAKRIIRFNHAQRSNHLIPKEAPPIEYISR